MPVPARPRRPAPLAAAALLSAALAAAVGCATPEPEPRPSETPIDLGGAFVMPGLVNLHAHIGNTIDFTRDAAHHTTGGVERNPRLLAGYGSVDSAGPDAGRVFRHGDRRAVGRVMTPDSVFLNWRT